MGQCISLGSHSTHGQKARDRVIRRELHAESTQARKMKEILLIGTSGSGTSTVHEQLREIYNESRTRVERRQYVPYIHEKCITQMKVLLGMVFGYTVFGYIREFEEESSDDLYLLRVPMNIQCLVYQQCFPFIDIPNLSEQGVAAAEIIQSPHRIKYRLTDEIVCALKILWNEPAIRKLYELRNITGIEDSSVYFWNNLDHIAESDYIPNSTEILLVRERSTGVIESVFEVDPQCTLRFIDVGQQRSEPRKWIHCFEYMTAILFVASLSSYDEVVTLHNGSTVNAMTHQLQLFDSIVNSTRTFYSGIILFLNKKDLFATKIQDVPLTKCPSFSRYHGPPHSYDETTKYIRKVFSAQIKRYRQQQGIYIFIVDATDIEDLRNVLPDAVQSFIIDDALFVNVAGIQLR